MRSLLFGALLAASSLVSADIVTQEVEYVSGGVTLKGYVAYDDAINAPRPGIAIVHDWDGITEYEMSRARQLAALGYVGFAVDIYGKDSRPKTMQENGQQAGKYRGDLPLFRTRLQAGLDAMSALPQVEKSKLAAIGYCFGGGGVLEMARAQMPVAGVVSFHGGLGTTMPATSPIKAKVMVVHAAQDPSVPVAQFTGFLAEMKAAQTDYQTLVYNLDVHPFTAPGPNYKPDADRRSWEAMKLFFLELFGPVK